MIVADIRTHRLAVPFAEPPRTGFLTLPAIDLLVVEVETRDGVVGTGHLHPLAGGMRTLETCVREMLAPLLLGRDVSDPRATRARLREALLIQGRMGITEMAISAVDVALWDALGRARGEPLWRLWGGRAAPIPTYGSGCYRGLGRDGMIGKAERYVAQGFEAIKMQVAHLFTPEEDVANVAAMREALGPGVAIMIDVNQGWDAERAIATGRALARFDPFWLEEPVRCDDFDGTDRVAAALPFPVATGENNWAPEDHAPYLDAHRIPFLQPDVMRGGFTGILDLAREAEAAGARIAPHLFPELMSHVLAAIPNGAWLEYMGWFDALWTEPLTPEGGTLTPPDRPGHGMDLRPDLFTDFRVED